MGDGAGQQQAPPDPSVMGFRLRVDSLPYEGGVAHWTEDPARSPWRRFLFAAFCPAEGLERRPQHTNAGVRLEIR